MRVSPGPARPGGPVGAPARALAGRDLIAGAWVELGPRGSARGQTLRWHNPASPEQVVWEGTPEPDHVDQGIAAARRAFPAWSRLPFAERARVLESFAEIATARAGEMAERIGAETGKVLWEARAEAALLAGKVRITLEDPARPEAGLRRVAAFQLALSDSRTGRCLFRPHGVMAVVGPFNFPAHLPTGHIVPALLMGNTVVLKPSDKAPGVGQLLAELFDEALRRHAAPPGVLNLVQGGAPIAAALTSHPGLDGVLFTGSWPVGRRIMQANLDHPGRILALEMGGNNAAVVLPDADLRQAAIEILRCAFNTTGQRCTCTRRAVVHERIADRLLPALVEAARRLVVGDPRSEGGVFMGPIISQAARGAVIEAQDRFEATGAEILLRARCLPGPETSPGGWYLSPAVVRVDRFHDPRGTRPVPAESERSAAPGGAEGVKTAEPEQIVSPGDDVEVFGPLLRVCVVRSLEEAIEQANATRFGLAASIFTSDAAAAERFLAEARAGCVNVNTGTAGASSKLPFGGLGHSGNHRPAGSFAPDYCAYPVAVMHETGSAATLAEGMSFEDAWLR
ncbi:MAG TPA: aldehyde dehydrogenase family protein [Phycisphaerales bacterium]|nr:aldehyde dehydrogenase family protein [Phycisphaerales bacterium]